MTRKNIKSRLIAASKTPFRDTLITMLLIWGFFLKLNILGWYSGDPLGIIFLISISFGGVILFIIVKSGEKIARSL